jgi:hypothetical protein
VTFLTFWAILFAINVVSVPILCRYYLKYEKESDGSPTSITLGNAIVIVIVISTPILNVFSGLFCIYFLLFEIAPSIVLFGGKPKQ